MKNLMGLHGLFFFYGSLAIANSIWGWKTIPDNRGISLAKVGVIPDHKGNGEMSENQPLITD